MILESLWIKIMATIVIAGIGLAATYYIKLKSDNPIERETGLIMVFYPEHSGEELELHPNLRK